MFQEAGKVRAIVMGNLSFSESAQDKVPSCGHMQSITRATRLRAVGPGHWGDTEKDVG